MNKNLSPSFTLKECEQLIEYYSPLIISKNILNDVPIESLQIRTYDNGENSVICFSKRDKELPFKKDLCVVALQLGLIHPNELLKNLNL